MLYLCTLEIRSDNIIPVFFCVRVPVDVIAINSLNKVVPLHTFPSGFWYSKLECFSL